MPAAARGGRISKINGRKSKLARKEIQGKTEGNPNPAEGNPNRFTFRQRRLFNGLSQGTKSGQAYRPSAQSFHLPCSDDYGHHSTTF
jgi:hypothetical protein